MHAHHKSHLSLVAHLHMGLTMRITHHVTSAFSLCHHTQDPVATSLFAAGLILLAGIFWFLGFPFALAALLLFDIRPPPFRDPFPPPPANLIAALPSRADRMI
jgi:hypothetical protein